MTTTADPTTDPTAATLSGASSDWHADRLDLDAYRRRIGHDGPLRADAATLAALHRAHARAIPFENLDVVLGRGVSLDERDIQDKMVHSPRGGYCYEQNMLFGLVAERLGLPVTRAFGRPLLESDKPIPRTHLVLLVETEDGTRLCDVGFGDDGPIEPLPLRDGLECEQDGWWYRLRTPAGDPREWVLSLWQDERWFDLYWFSVEPHHRIDCEVANHFISAHPRSPFTGRVFVEHVEAGQRLHLNDTTLTITRPGRPDEVSTIDPADLPRRLRDHFDIVLTDAEADRVVRELRSFVAGT